MEDLERILREQRECRDYIVQCRGSDTDGAWRGLEDWLLEELWLEFPEKFEHTTTARLQRAEQTVTGSELPLP